MRYTRWVPEQAYDGWKKGLAMIVFALGMLLVAGVQTFVSGAFALGIMMPFFAVASLAGAFYAASSPVL